MKRSFILGILLTISTLTALADAATPFSEAQIQSVQNILKEYITSNPEVIGQALKELQARHEKEIAENSRKAVEENKKEIFERATDKVLGNTDGTKNLVIFIDPYCGYCHQFLTQVDKAIKNMSDLKVIVKYFPLFGDPSLNAIKALTAADIQGKYKDMLNILHKQKEPLSLDQLKTTARSIKTLNHKQFTLDIDAKKVDALITGNIKLANKLGVRALPTMVINDKIIQGVLSAEQLQSLLTSGTGSTPPTKTDE